MEGSFSIKANPVEQVAGRALTHLKSLDPESRNKRVARLHASGAWLKPTQQQWALLAGTSTTGINKALNGSRRKRTPSPALTDLGNFLEDVHNTALRIQWRSPEVERAELEDLDRLFGQFLAKHESMIETWRHHRSGSAAELLAIALMAFDRLVTTILSNNNIG